MAEPADIIEFCRREDWWDETNQQSRQSSKSIQNYDEELKQIY